jgi:LAS seventeen-binding protein 5
VKKKVLAILASWSRQFKDDRNAAGIAGLYRQVRSVEPPRKTDANWEAQAEREREAEQRQKEKEEAKRKAKEERRRLEDEARRKKAAAKNANAARKHFDFERVRSLHSTFVPCYELISTVHRRNQRYSLLSPMRPLP